MAPKSRKTSTPASPRPVVLDQQQARALCDAGYMPLSQYIRLCDDKGWPLNREERALPPSAAAALSLFKSAGVAVTKLDEHCYLVDDHWMFWPVTGFWRHPDKTQGNSARKLVAEIARRHQNPAGLDAVGKVLAS